MTIHDPHQLPLHLILHKYFPHLTPDQQEKFAALEILYKEWNEKINLISRKDIDHLNERHILHSLAVAKFIQFKVATRVLDVGTGGGFPGIPLAIIFPGVKFHLVDSIGKKIKVVKGVAKELHLENVTAEQIRAEEITGKFDFIVSRAVASLETVYKWTRGLVRSEGKNTLANGWIFLKGGDLENEIIHLRKKVLLTPVSDYYEEEFFKEKFIVYFN